jgi:multicomponent K+:H+ antiporter subunit F
MIVIATHFSLICFALGAGLNLVRLISAPALPDKVLALDTMVINVIAMIVIWGIAHQHAMNFEAAMLLAMTGFFATVCFCRLILRGRIIE